MTIEEQIKTGTLPLARKLTINLLHTAQWATDILAVTTKSYELSLQQFNVLRILRGQKGKPAHLSTINDRMVARASNTTRLVDKLVQKELVQRKTCPSNRRKIEITITDKGLTLLKEIDIEVTVAETYITGTLNDTEKEQLNTLLNKLRTT